MESGDDYSVPTATRDPATDLTDGNCTRTLNRTAQAESTEESMPTIEFIIKLYKVKLIRQKASYLNLKYGVFFYL